MKPFIHAKASVSKYGGKPEDYLPIHDFLDCSKATHADLRHRAILHNSLGPYLAEQVFGHNIINSDGKEISVRDVCEDHIIQDLDFIPSVTDWLNHMEKPWWMGGRRKSNKKSDIVD